MCLHQPVFRGLSEPDVFPYQTPDSDLSKLFVVRLTMGRNHTAALVVNGRYFAWGSNTFGQVGPVCLPSSVRFGAHIARAMRREVWVCYIVQQTVGVGGRVGFLDIAVISL